MFKAKPKSFIIIIFIDFATVFWSQQKGVKEHGPFSHVNLPFFPYRLYVVCHYDLWLSPHFANHWPEVTYFLIGSTICLEGYTSPPLIKSSTIWGNRRKQHLVQALPSLVLLALKPKHSMRSSEGAKATFPWAVLMEGRSQTLCWGLSWWRRRGKRSLARYLQNYTRFSTPSMECMSLLPIKLGYSLQFCCSRW